MDAPKKRLSVKATDSPLDAEPLLQRIRFDNVRNPQQQVIHTSKKPVRWLPWLALLAAGLILLVIWQEYRTTYYQSEFWHRLSRSLTYQLQPGNSEAINFPADGPFDQRYGYTRLADWSVNLPQHGFTIAEQVRFSEALQRYTNLGFFPPYSEKPQAGLHITDCQQEQLYQFSSPAFQFDSLQQLSPVIIRTLLFVENRKLLEPANARVNPAIDSPRLIAAAMAQTKRALGMDAPAAGGSTLATQIEKYRHSPHGLTQNFHDKLQQMVSASVRAYQPSVYTLNRSKQIALDYLNSVPLAANTAYGEIHGFGDGLIGWFNSNPARVNALLMQTDEHITAEHGQALRQVLALVIAQRRPSYYLLQGHQDLEQLIDRYLPLLHQQGIISAALFHSARQQPLRFVTTTPALRPFDKTAHQVRNRLSGLLGQSFYQLDRLDLSASSTLNLSLQQQITQYLNKLAMPDYAAAYGLTGERLLTASQTAHVRYSFTLYERTAAGNKIRVQTDSTDQPFDLNEASKLELGSTAKLRVLATYLEIITELHQLYSEEQPAQLRYLDIAPQDNLTQWAVNYLIQHPDSTLDTMLEAALERTYSADPKESFFTGGGLHTFSNFRPEEDLQTPSVKEALRRSVNLPFVRLMQDIVSYSIHHAESSSYQLLKNDNDPRRDQYLRRFADREGSTYLQRFWRKYHTRTPAEQLDMFLTGLRQTPERLAAAYRYIRPDDTPEQFTRFMQQWFSQRHFPADRWHALYNKYQPEAFDLPEHAYLARSHPLELWLLAYLNRNPSADFATAIQDSAEQRQQVYRWLFRTQSKSARDTRIRTMLEIEAFWDIHQRWQKLGYPFEYLVPSLATALGSSGDRPSALAELMGIILNNGKRLPVLRFDELHFATQTPYETRFISDHAKARQVMAPAVATALKTLLSEIVTEGTARRLLNTFDPQLQLGGKTGTGDNRISTVSRRGETLHSTALNRTATFTFYLGDSHFGVLTAYVPGRTAEHYQFTSALPLQVLKGMKLLLEPYLLQPDISCH
ncbi:transglycosylase domain-containing protein [Chromatiaceae bacterium AAb-1]|nr:transglycosylase domain-containing protein [Chromatiaceae bacterium AAb-1]